MERRKLTQEAVDAASLSDSSKGHVDLVFPTRASDPVDTMEQCQDSCYAAADPATFVNSSVALAKKKDDDDYKPSCCKGGVSALKMAYHGPSRVELFTAPYAALTDYNLVDPCNDAKSGSSKSSSSSVEIDYSIKFVSCARCFPSNGTTATCDLDNDVWDSQLYSSEDEVCLAHVSSQGELVFDIKFPTDIHFYYLEEESNTDDLRLVPLHTSCSKPIYSPYGIQLGECKSNDEYFVDTTGKTDADLSESPLLQFIDGVSAKDPSATFADCTTTETPDKPKKETCCKGGVVVLQTRLENADLNGTLTFEAPSDEVICNEYGRPDSKGKGKGKGKKKGRGRDLANNESPSVVFVTCEDPCLDIFSGETCTNVTHSLPVGPGADICFVSWDAESNSIAYDTKMPTNLHIFFLPDDESSAHIVTVHTSCSRPVYPPYAQV
jgi:hypothetical protein